MMVIPINIQCWALNSYYIKGCLYLACIAYSLLNFIISVAQTVFLNFEPIATSDLHTCINFKASSCAYVSSLFVVLQRGLVRSLGRGQGPLR